MIKLLRNYSKMGIMLSLDGHGVEIFHILTGLAPKHKILFVQKLKKKRKIKKFCQLTFVPLAWNRHWTDLLKIRNPIYSKAKFIVKTNEQPIKVCDKILIYIKNII